MKRRAFFSRIALVICALTIYPALANAVDVSGDITTTTWTEKNSPYCVTDTVTIPSGNILTIEAGVDVLFDADVQFIVQGAIHAHGTEMDSVRFVKGTSDMWRGLRISGGDSSSFTYTRISDENARGDLPKPEIHGGGLFITGSDTRVSLTNCTVSGNSAWSYGGGIYNYSGTVTLTRCTISGNEAAAGCGIYNGSSAILRNCFVTWNHGGNGAGINTGEHSTTTLMNCTISRNWGADNGGGIYNSCADITMTNCILWGNDAIRKGRDIYPDVQLVDASYTNFELRP